MKAEIAELYREIMGDIFEEQEGDREKELSRLDRQRKAVEGKLLKIDQKYHIDEEMDRESFERLKRDYKAEREKLEQGVEELGHRDTNFLKHLDFGLSLLTNLDTYYEEAQVEVKKKITSSIFPEGFVIEGGIVRTDIQNEFASLTCSNSSDFQNAQKSASPKN